MTDLGCFLSVMIQNGGKGVDGGEDVSESTYGDGNWNDWLFEECLNCIKVRLYGGALWMVVGDRVFVLRGDGGWRSRK